MQLNIKSNQMLTMTKSNNLGIWMDHASAHIMEYSPDSMETKIIESNFTNQEKRHSKSKGENQMHNKEQQLQNGYYLQLGDVIRSYEKVLLFGPTDAKTELFNLLKADPHFQGVKIEVQPADKMTENQQHAFVKDYFSKH
jgi:hypothetical protein